MSEELEYTEQKKPVPKVNTKTKKIPKVTEQKIENPEYNPQPVEQPEVTNIEIPVPHYQNLIIPAPNTGHLQNQVTIDGITIEIMPTKLKYQRDQTAAFYKILRQAPVVEILSLDEDFFGTRSPDKMLFDWLIAVTDSPEFVKDHYDNFTSQNIDQMLEIFCRLNGFTDREERKNRQAQGATTH